MKDPRIKLTYKQLSKTQNIVSGIVLALIVLICIALVVATIIYLGMFALMVLVWLLPFICGLLIKIFGTIAQIIVHILFSNADDIFMV